MSDERIIDLITEELNKRDVIDMFKNDKDLEKRIKSIVADVVVEMFRVLWQHNGIFKTLAH